MLRRKEIKTLENSGEELVPILRPDPPQVTEPVQPDSSGNSHPAALTWRPIRPTDEERMATRAAGDGSEESIIGCDDFFNGAYKSERGVRVQGQVEGSIESKGHILIEQQARVSAEMSAEDITVAGWFDGKVECRRRFEIAPTGVVMGEVNTDMLVVQEGGYFDG